MEEIARRVSGGRKGGRLSNRGLPLAYNTKPKINESKRLNAHWSIKQGFRL